jgi:hypothetical protein
MVVMPKALSRLEKVKKRAWLWHLREVRHFTEDPDLRFLISFLLFHLIPLLFARWYLPTHPLA